MSDELTPVVPGQSYYPGKRPGPAHVLAVGSGRGYFSAVAIDLAVFAAKERGHVSPDVEAFQLIPERATGKVYGIPCDKEVQGSYLFHKARTARNGWVRLHEIYDVFNINVPTRMQFVVPVTTEQHKTLGHCIVLEIGQAQLRSVRYRIPKAVEEAAPTSED